MALIALREAEHLLDLSGFGDNIVLVYKSYLSTFMSLANKPTLNAPPPPQQKSLKSVQMQYNKESY